MKRTKNIFYGAKNSFKDLKRQKKEFAKHKIKISSFRSFRLKKRLFLVGRHAWLVVIGDFRFGEIYDYVEEGIEATGDYDNGECGIIIRDIDYAKSGDWKCEITRKNRPGSGRIGSEATSSLFRVDVFRTSRLNDDSELLLQVNS